MEAILSDLDGNILCAKCGRPYARTALKHVGARADRHFVRCTCERCHTDAILIVIVREVANERPALPAVPSFTREDILDAADLMRPANVTLAQLGLA